MDHPALPDIFHATDALLRTVDSMAPDDYAAPSLLPDWTRAHVIAHLALNARGFEHAIEAAGRGERAAVYLSNEARNDDISKAADLAPDELREFVFEACGRWRDVIEQANDPSARFDRVPGGPELTVAEGIVARWREVEIHHADLGLGFGPSDWSSAFVDEVLPGLVAFRSAQVDLTIETPEGPIALGAGGPVVSGSRQHAAWWLLGRGTGDGLSGELPRLGPWR